jgi:hypothetical protein
MLICDIEIFGSGGEGGDHSSLESRPSPPLPQYRPSCMIPFLRRLSHLFFFSVPESDQDIKLENILLRKKDNDTDVVLADFGASLSLSLSLRCCASFKLLHVFSFTCLYVCVIRPRALRDS